MRARIAPYLLQVLILASLLQATQCGVTNWPAAKLGLRKRNGTWKEENLIAWGGGKKADRGRGRNRQGNSLDLENLSLAPILAGIQATVQTVSRLFIKKSIGLGIAWALLQIHRSPTSDSKGGDQGKEDTSTPKDKAERVISKFVQMVKPEKGKLPDISVRDGEEAQTAQARLKDAANTAAAAAYNAALLLTLQPGDHLRYQGAFGFQSMAHHGIYVGNGEIVHFTGGAGSDTSLEAKRKARITKESVRVIADLANSAQAFLQVVPQPENAKPREEIVKRSLQRVGDAGYNLLLSNCEHFAIWCVTGESRSDQVMAALQAPALFVEEVAKDVINASKHPIKGKPIRHAAETVKTALAIVSIHFTFCSW